MKQSSDETPMETLPPGKIFGMNITQPQVVSSTSTKQERLEDASDSCKSDNSNVSVSSTSQTTLVSQNAIDMLATLFPHRKRSVLELVLRRCDLDLLRAIEQCSKTQQQSPKFEVQSAFRPIASSAAGNQGMVASTQALHQVPTQNPSNYTSLIGEFMKIFNNLF